MFRLGYVYLEKHSQNAAERTFSWKFVFI